MVHRGPIYCSLFYIKGRKHLNASKILEPKANSLKKKTQKQKNTSHKQTNKQKTRKKANTERMQPPELLPVWLKMYVDDFF